MSTLKTNTLTGTTSAGSILVTGEGGSTTTSLQQGLCKAWALLDLDNSTPVNFDSFNLGSVTDNGTADMTQNFTNNMGSANYAHAGYPMTTASSVQARTAGGHTDFPTSSAVRHQYGYPSSTGGNGTNYEDTQAYLIVQGDLA